MLRKYFLCALGTNKLNVFLNAYQTNISYVWEGLLSLFQSSRLMSSRFLKQNLTIDILHNNLTYSHRISTTITSDLRQLASIISWHGISNSYAVPFYTMLFAVTNEGNVTMVTEWSNQYLTSHREDEWMRGLNTPLNIDEPYIQT